MKKLLVLAIALIGSTAMYVNAQEVKTQEETKKECVEQKEEATQEVVAQEEVQKEEKENQD